MIFGYSVNWPLVLFLCFLIFAPISLNMYLMKTNSFFLLAVFLVAMSLLWKYYKIAYR